jgi:hypothetical protein
MTNCLEISSSEKCSKFKQKKQETLEILVFTQRVIKMFDFAILDNNSDYFTVSERKKKKQYSLVLLQIVSNFGDFAHMKVNGLFTTMIYFFHSLAMQYLCFHSFEIVSFYFHHIYIYDLGQVNALCERR